MSPKPFGDRLYTTVPLLDSGQNRPHQPYTADPIATALIGGYFAGEYDGQHVGSKNYPIDFRTSPWEAAATINTLVEQEVYVCDWDNFPGTWSALVCQFKFAAYVPFTRVDLRMICTQAAPAQVDTGTTISAVIGDTTLPPEEINAGLITDGVSWNLLVFTAYCDVALANGGIPGGANEISVRVVAGDEQLNNPVIIRPISVGVRAVKR